MKPNRQPGSLRSWPCRLHRGLLWTAAVLGAPLARADTLDVPAEYSTIQAAIDAAFDGDEVHVARGTYDEHIDFLGKTITVRSVDGPNVTTLGPLGPTLIGGLPPSGQSLWYVPVHGSIRSELL